MSAATKPGVAPERYDTVARIKNLVPEIQRLANGPKTVARINKLVPEIERLARGPKTVARIDELVSKIEKLIQGRPIGGKRGGGP